MADLIDRQAAIDALNGEIKIKGRANAEAVKDYVILVADRLARLPSAQPERGLWIKMNGDRGYECSKCGWESDIIWDFCPNCGALNIDVWENTDEVEE